jgi:hypothetical protein
MILEDIFDKIRKRTGGKKKKKFSANARICSRFIFCTMVLAIGPCGVW